MLAIVENVSRRGFIDGAAAMGGLVVGMQLLPRRTATPAAAAKTDVPNFNPTTFIGVDTTGRVTIEARRAERVQVMHPEILIAVVDELEADLSRVYCSQAVGHESTRREHNVEGSRSMRRLLQPVRQMGAAVRQMLETAAAALWGVEVTQVHARNHEISHLSTGRVLGYGDVAAVARALSVPRPYTLRLKSRRDYRFIGEALRIVELADITTRTDQPGHRARPV